MKVIESIDVRKEADKTANDRRVADIKDFQASTHYGTIIEIIDEALGHSEVISLLRNKTGDVSESEVGRLTISEFMANKKIQDRIRIILTKKYE